MVWSVRSWHTGRIEGGMDGGEAMVHLKFHSLVTLTWRFSAEAIQLGSICSAAGVAGIWSGAGHEAGLCLTSLHAPRYSSRPQDDPAGALTQSYIPLSNTHSDEQARF